MRRSWRQGRSSQDAYQRLVEHSLAALDAREAAQSRLFHLDQASWAIDQSQGTITFTRPDSLVATAPVQIIGTLDPSEGTWLWGWDHPSVRPELGKHARRVRGWGAEHHVEELTSRLLMITDDTLIRRFAAVACELNDAQGVWRCPTERALVLVTFGTVTLNGPPKLSATTTTRAEDWTENLDRSQVVTAPEAVNIVQDWMTQIHRIESRYRKECVSTADAYPSDEVVARAIANKQPVYERFWRREDEYHRPCSVGAIRWYDVESMRDWQVYRLNDDAWRVTYHEPITGPMMLAKAYDVRRFPDGLRIVDHLD
jgi:hypothetical protein